MKRHTKSGKKYFPFSLQYLTFLIFFFQVFLTVNYADAQQKYFVSVYNSDNVLPQNSVGSIAFDKRGYTWICTQFGLVRYDGLHFRTFNSLNSPSLKDNRFFYVAPNQHGALFVSLSNFHIIQIMDSGFIYRPDLTNTDNCFLGNRFFDLSPFQVFNSVSRTLNLYKNGEADWQIFPVDSSKCYLVNTKGIGYFNGEKNYTRLMSGIKQGFLLNKTLYVEFKNGKIKAFNDTGVVNENVQMTGDIDQNNFYKKNKIINSFYNSGTTDECFFWINHTMYSARASGLSLSTTLEMDSLNVIDVNTVVRNPVSGDIYIGSAIQGLFILHPEKFTALIAKSASADVNDQQYYSILEGSKNNIISIIGLTYNGSKWSPLPFKSSGGKCLFHDHNNHLWYPKDGNVIEADSQYQTLSVVAMPPGSFICDIGEDARKNIWVATTKSLGIIRNRNFKELLNEKGFPDNAIETFIFESDSLIWIGTTKGLALYHVKKNRSDDLSALRDKDVRTLKKDANGTLWIGTYGNGFYCYRNKKIIKFPTDKNNFLSTAHCFLLDKNGFLWITTNKGLFEAKRSDLIDFADGKTKDIHYQYYDRQDGLSSNEFNGGCNPSGIILSDGAFVFPSMDGLTKFYPEKIHPSLPDYPIYIDEISADGIFLSTNKPLTLKSHFNQLTISASSPYYGNKNNNTLEYRIHGINETWTNVNDEGEITITSLPAGHYQLQLRHTAGFGPGNYVFKNLSFVVAPAFYETRLFRLLVLLLFVVFIWSLFRIRYALLRKQKFALEVQIAERTSALRETVDKLQLSENALFGSIQQKEKISSILVHDLKSQLRFLALISDHIHHLLDDDKKDLKKLAREMKKTSRRIGMFTDEFLAWMLAAKEDFTSNNEVISINSLGEELADFFSEMMASNENILQIKIAEDLKITTDEKLLRVILRNLIDNSNKHTSNGIISLEAAACDHIVEIKVSDTGQGMTKEQLKSFTNIDGYSLGFSLSVGNQLGSRIVRDFIQKLGGMIFAESEIGHGTIISIKLPVIKPGQH
jgi:ligand-binding sensor domain-containing protein/signal transduction histidine kinase